MSSLESEELQALWTEDVLGDVLQLGSGDGIDALQQDVYVAQLTAVEVMACKVEGKLLTVVAGYGELTFQLSLGGSQLTVGEGMLHDAVQLAMDKAEAVVYVVMVTAEVDAPAAGVAVGDRGTLDGIDEAVTFAKAKVKAGVHAWTTKDIVEQIEGHAMFVVPGIGLTTEHDMSLMVGVLSF